MGETVCWKWTNEDLEHNVKEVTGMKSTTYVENGVYSGVAAKTVDFHHTFTENTTFYYACEPHRYGNVWKVIVGDGGVVEEPATTDDDKEEKNTPGFLGVTAILAALGAVLVARKRQNDKLRLRMNTRRIIAVTMTIGLVLVIVIAAFGLTNCYI